MNPSSPLLLGAALALAFTSGATDPAALAKGTATMTTARGPFDVDVAPLANQPFSDGNALGRYQLDKRYHGELEATAGGEMLTATSPIAGSAGYVAVERVEGTLGGRRGSFLLQHRGTMGHGSQELDIRVVPDSGTGELAGLEGRLEIRIGQAGEHFYELTYTLGGRR